MERVVDEAQSYVDFYGLAFVHAGLSNRDESFRWLEKAYQQHSRGLIYLAVDPFWYGMRSDPRYADLLHRIGLARTVSALIFPTSNITLSDQS